MLNMKSCRLQAPAKINLILRVVGRRADGYHELDTLLAPISLCDQIRLTQVPSGITVSCPRAPEISNQENLAYQAAQRFFSHTGIEPCVHIIIDKRIAIAGGLGGGSSDAASTLLGLQQMFGHPLGKKKLHEIALTLGADVPFFLQRGPCWAKGIGERLTPTTLPEFWVLLATAPFGITTRLVFENLKYSLTSAHDDVTHEDPDRGFVWLANKLANDLRPIAEKLHPEIRLVTGDLHQAGAAGAMMSGSGPSVYGIFPTAISAQNALMHLNKRKGWTYLVSRASAEADTAEQ